MTDAGSTMLGDQSYRVYNASNLPGATVVAGWIKPSELTSTSTPGPTELAIIVVGIMLCVVGGGVVLVTRRARRTAPQPRDEGPEADPAQQRLHLVVEIAVLDDRYEAGEISLAEHKAQRKFAKKRLRELTSI
jgi:hypothetical protein